MFIIAQFARGSHAATNPTSILCQSISWSTYRNMCNFLQRHRVLRNFSLVYDVPCTSCHSTSCITSCHFPLSPINDSTHHISSLQITLMTLWIFASLSKNSRQILSFSHCYLYCFRAHAYARNMNKHCFYL